MPDLDRMLQGLRESVEDCSETEESISLTLTKQEFMEKMLKEEKGQALLDLLESGESTVCERMGLITGYIKDGQVYFDIPGWNNLVAHLKIVESI
jgi:hypothetical protein